MLTWSKSCEDLPYMVHLHALHIEEVQLLFIVLFFQSPPDWFSISYMILRHTTWSLSWFEPITDENKRAFTTMPAYCVVCHMRAITPYAGNKRCLGPRTTALMPAYDSMMIRTQNTTRTSDTWNELGGTAAAIVVMGLSLMTCHTNSCPKFRPN